MTAIIISLAIVVFVIISIMISVRKREDERFANWMRDFEFSLGRVVGQVDEECICKELFQNHINPKEAVEIYLLKKDAEARL